MHDLDRIQAELADDTFIDDQFFEQASPGDADDFVDEFDEEDGDDYEDGDLDDEGDADESAIVEEDLPLDEDEEIDLASNLLAATDEEQLERAVRKIVRPDAPRPRRRRRRTQSAGLQQERSPERRRRRRRRRRGLLGKALKGIAKKALPVLGGALGSVVPVVGTAAGAALASGVGKAFGLELEGLSPEDSAFEVARRIVRLGAEAADETDNIDPSVDDETAAKVGMIRAAGKHAPGVMPRPDAAPSGPAAAPTHAPPGPSARRPMNGGTPGQTGRWERRGNHIVLFGL